MGENEERRMAFQNGLIQSHGGRRHLMCTICVLMWVEYRMPVGERRLQRRLRERQSLTGLFGEKINVDLP